MDTFFQRLLKEDVSSRVVSAAAFCKARQKISPAAFVEINDLLTSLFYRKADVMTLNGRRLLAVDGSTAVLPASDELLNTYGNVVTNSTSKRCLGRVSLVYDVHNKLVLEADLKSYATAELPMAFQQIVRLHERGMLEQTILLGDRGYSAFAFLSFLQYLNVEFLVRLKINHPLVKALIASKQPEYVGCWMPRHVHRKSMPAAYQNVPLDKLKLRVVVCHNKHGAPVYLATNMLDSDFGIADLGMLYRMRWGIEEQYKVMKCRLHMENFSGKSGHCIQQEFHATVLYSNMVSALSQDVEIEVRNDTSREHEYQLSRTETLSKGRDSVVMMFLRRGFTSILEALQTVWRSCISPIRPGRHYARPSTGRTGMKAQGHHIAYKPY